MDLWWLLGYTRIGFHTSSESVVLPLRAGTGKRTFLDFCKDVIPTCRLNPFLCSGHLQTLWTTVKGVDVQIFYKRKIVEAEDPRDTGTFALDFVVDDGSGSDQGLPKRTTYYTEEELASLGSSDAKPMLVVLHGLSGGSHETYLRAALKPLVEKHRWAAVVINARGCASSKITSSALYNARSTEDLHQTVRWLRKTFPKRPLYGIGFSLGANKLVTYLGEQGTNCELRAAAVVSNPWNLEISHVILKSTWIGLEIYSRAMGSSMKALFERHADEIIKNTRIDMQEVRKIRYLHDFDRAVQCPTWGYPTETAYYRDASSVDPLLAVRVPLLAINSEDDPIAAGAAVPFEEFRQNPFAVLCFTTTGGHLGWFQLGGHRWFAQAVQSFFDSFHDQVDLPALRRTSEETAGDLEVSSQGKVFDPLRRRLGAPREL